MSSRRWCLPAPFHDMQRTALGPGERVVYDRPPSLRNEEVGLTALEGGAISRLRTESMFGASDLAVCIGEGGKARWAEVTRSSDSPELDGAALRVVSADMTPATEHPSLAHTRSEP